MHELLTFTITQHMYTWMDKLLHHGYLRGLNVPTVNILESGSQCEKNFGVDLSISVLGT